MCAQLFEYHIKIAMLTREGLFVKSMSFLVNGANDGFIKFNIIGRNSMGQQICGSKNSIGFNEDDRFEIVFGFDPKETSISHNKPISCRDPEKQKVLDNFTQLLRNNNSLYKDPKMSTDPIILKSKTNELRCTYERPYIFLNEIMKGQAYRLIDEHDASADNVEVHDEVLQYFGTFLCFLADKPNLIKKIIKTDENGYGIHCIQAYTENRKTNFFIDDYILCQDSQPLFSQPYKMMYMWTCLLEKAWLKIKGHSAKRVEHNNPEEVFQHFLPIPIQKIYLQDGLNTNAHHKMRKFFENFDKSKQKGYILTSRKDPEHSIGLSGHKHFYLLDTFIYGEKRLFYIRNPCGKQNFRGLYKDIPQEILDKLYKRQFMSVTPGNFILDEEQFIQQIGSILMIDYIQGNNFTNFSFNVENNEQFFIGFDLKHPGLLNLCISQISKDKDKKYYPLMYHVVRLNDKRILGGNQNQQGCFGVKNTYLLDNFTENTTAGKYLIRLKKKQYYKNLSSISTSIVSYYKDSVKFDILSAEESALKWKEYLIDEGKKRLEYKLAEKGQMNTMEDIAHIVCWLGDIIYIYIEKRNDKKREVYIEVNFPQLMNLQCISHPEIKRNNQFKKLSFEDHCLIIFEKIILNEETHIRKYHLEAF